MLPFPFVADSRPNDEVLALLAGTVDDNVGVELLSGDGLDDDCAPDNTGRLF